MIRYDPRTVPTLCCTQYSNTYIQIDTFLSFLCFRVEAEGGQAAAELSEAAQGELMDQCEDQFAQLEKVNSSSYMF